MSSNTTAPACRAPGEAVTVFCYRCTPHGRHWKRNDPGVCEPDNRPDETSLFVSCDARPYSTMHLTPKEHQSAPMIQLSFLTCSRKMRKTQGISFRFHFYFTRFSRVNIVTLSEHLPPISIHDQNEWLLPIGSNRLSLLYKRSILSDNASRPSTFKGTMKRRSANERRR